MEIKGTLQLEDLLSAHWLDVRSRRSEVFLAGFQLVGGSLLVWFCFVGVEPSRADWWSGWVILAALFYFLFLVLVYVPLKIRRNYRQRKNPRKELTITITDNSLNIQFENGHYNAPWEEYFKWRENRNLFLLYHDENHTYQIIPKGFFRSDGEIDMFQQTLRDKVARR
jgi:hypothetical protein